MDEPTPHWQSLWVPWNGGKLCCSLAWIYRQAESSGDELLSFTCGLLLWLTYRFTPHVNSPFLAPVPLSRSTRDGFILLLIPHTSHSFNCHSFSPPSCPAIAPLQLSIHSSYPIEPRRFSGSPVCRDIAEAERPPPPLVALHVVVRRTTKSS